MVKLDKFCIYTPLKVLAISLIISFAVSIVGGLAMPSHPTQHGEASLGGFYIGAICATLSIGLSVLSYSIAFNLYKTVRDKFLFSFLSFYSPLIVLLFLFVIYDDERTGFFLYVQLIIFAVPFLIPQTYYFVKFRKRLSTGEILEDFYIDTYPDEDN